MKQKVLIVVRYYSIEPLGILYLTGVARDAGWDRKVICIEESDFAPLYETVREWKPDIVGFQIWTGYHLPAFAACDVVRSMGVPVVIGGPHATYFDSECLEHADWVTKGGSFGLFAQLLDGALPHGVHFSIDGRVEGFPFPDRDVVYDAYPQFGASPIKSIMASVGCPFFCTYCYAPAFNDMHGGFKLTVRPVDGIVAEARDILERWPLSMIYFQDDIFGYDTKWLEQFATAWKRDVGVPFHCQIRLELTRGDKGARRLDLFREAGCSGITLAIESGDAFLRDHVLFRHMPDELILDGCARIMDRGMTLRTEQILAVPFSDVTTELATLDLNSRINPTMAWTSILAPYQGTDMGTIAGNFGIYTGVNDDLADSFFDRSVLRHIDGGPRDIGAIVDRRNFGQKDRPLLKMQAVQNGELTAKVLLDDEDVGEVTFLSEQGNESYRATVVRLQRLFMWLSKVPEAANLGEKLLQIPDGEWTWKRMGETTEFHLAPIVGLDRLTAWKRQLADELECSPESLPPGIAENPWFFVFLPSGAELAMKATVAGIFEHPTTTDMLDELGTLTRRHLFHYDLYRIEEPRDAIALSVPPSAAELRA